MGQMQVQDDRAGSAAVLQHDMIASSSEACKSVSVTEH